jgi:gentisate 1,2-dioxygenase
MTRKTKTSKGLPEFPPEVRAGISWIQRERQMLEEGQVVIKAKDRPYRLMEQGHLRFMAMPGMEDTATDNMLLFVQDIAKHTGRHVHQGGYSLFIIEGEGYTVVDGVRHDWEEGDLVLLPIKAGGVEHQHFNLSSKPSRWLAIQVRPFLEMLTRLYEQKQVHPDWEKEHGKQGRRYF